MARTSKKSKKEPIVNSKHFYVGIYARLSVESDVRKKDSIDMQITLVKEYMKKHPEMELFDCYVDLGKTGTNFRREGFERMMEDVRNSRINCIIVKDLSRFGRNHIETGNYIQKIFPFMEVRFIAVTDGIDTFETKAAADEMALNLKNLLNEMYAKDISAKVKSSIQIRQEQGSYAGGVPPYGYTAGWEDGKRKLFTHKEAAEVVKDIYEMYLSGERLKQIVEILYARQIHRPAVYRKTGHVFCQKGELLEQWSSTAVKLILANPVYMGHSYYTQDAVVSEDSFFQAAALLGNTAQKHGRRGDLPTKVPLSEDIYDGVLYCGDCGKKMGRTANIKELPSGDMVRSYGYYCPSSRRIDALKCPPKSIGLAALNKLVKNALQQELCLSGLYQEKQEEKHRKQAEAMEKQFRQECLRYERKLENKKRQGSELYMKYYTGEISLKEYQKRRKEDINRIHEVSEGRENMIRQFHSMQQNEAEKKLFLLGLMECKEGIILTKEILRALIKRIEVYQNHKLKIIFADL